MALSGFLLDTRGVCVCVCVRDDAVLSHQDLQFAFPPERLFKLNDVLLPEHAQHLDLAQRRFSHDVVVFGLLELFDGDLWRDEGIGGKMVEPRT